MSPDEPLIPGPALTVMGCFAKRGGTWRGFADEVGCSHNHLFQVAQGKKELSAKLARQLKAVDPDFSADAQNAFCAAQRAGASAAAAADEEARA